MFMFDKKRDMSTVMKMRKKAGADLGPSPMKNEDSKEEDGSMDGRHMAMEDFHMASKEGSASKMKDAMINFLDLHAAAKQTEDEGESSGSTPSVAGDNLGY